MTDFSSQLSPSLVGSAQFNDLVMQGGDLVLTSDAQAGGTQSVLQDIIRRILTFRGEVFTDASLGLPWLNQALGVTPGLASGTFVNQVADLILGTPGVIRLDTLTASFDAPSRRLSLSFSAVTQGGLVSYDGSVSASGASP